jgi:hypothetical protein
MAYVLAENGSLRVPEGSRPACDHGISTKKDFSGQGVQHEKMYT